MNEETKPYGELISDMFSKMMHAKTCFESFEVVTGALPEILEAYVVFRKELHMTKNNTTEDWRKSAKADELREYIDKFLKPKKPTMGGLERELIIDFVAKEVDQARKDTLESVREMVEANRVVLRDEKDHLPATYQYLKGKNDLRDEILTHLTTLEAKDKDSTGKI